MASEITGIMTAFLGAIAGISLDLYNAARIDGCSKIRMMWHITPPNIRYAIIMLLSAGRQRIRSGRGGRLTYAQMSAWCDA